MLDTATQYRHFDTKQGNGVYISFERVEMPDTNCTPHEFDCYDENQINEWRRGNWYYIGIAAKARVEIVRNGVGTVYELLSPGLWGIESNSDESYLNEVFEDQCAELKADLKALSEIA